MKEKGMEKLIKLLDEYDSVQYHKINHKIENGSIYRNVGGTDGWHEVWRYCKQFGFIKRLVDNDKIDRDNQALQYAKSDLSKFFTEWEDKNGMSDDCTMLLMLLAIQENPISFLINVLK